AVGNEQTLRARDQGFRPLQRDQAAARAWVDDELTADRDLQRPCAERHLAWHDSRKARDVAALIGDPRGQVEMSPRIPEEDLAEVLLARRTRGPAVLGIDLPEQPDDRRHVLLRERPDPNHGDSARAGLQRRRRARARADEAGPRCWSIPRGHPGWTPH